MNSTFFYLQTHADYFKQHGRRIEYDKNQYIIRGDDPTHYVYFQENGLVKFSFMPTRHDERIIGFFLPGMTYTQNRSFFEGDGGGLEFTAVEPTTMYRITRDDFLKQMETDVAFKNDYLQLLLRNQIYLLERTIYMGESDTYHRMLRWLAMMAKYYGQQTADGLLITPKLTQTTMGNFLHASRESVSQALKRLERNGLISIKSKHILLLDPAKLQAAIHHNS